MQSYWSIEKFIPSFDAKYFGMLIYSHYKQQMRIGDKQCPLSYSSYAMPIGEVLLFTLKEKIEEICHKKLIPTYSYCRIYQNGDALKIHKDRNACEYSVTLNLYQDAPWSFFLENNESTIIECIQNPGDAIIYKGTEIKHFRNTFTGNTYIQLFLHYIDANGPYAGLLDYDTRQFLDLDKKPI